jgi:hypothetical protein
MPTKEKTMSKYLKRFNETGICIADVETVVADWDDSWFISQHHENYKLCRHDSEADNFTKTNFKCEISKQQAHEIIGRLNLIDTPSGFFNNARTWRTTYGER